MASTTIDVDTSSQSPRCILHLETEEKRPKEHVIVPFKPSNWESVKEAAARRKVKRNFQSSKYHAIIEELPDELDICQHGYHTQCYKNLTAVPVDELAQSQESISGKKHLRSNRPEAWSLIHSQSIAGIFPKTCIFCNKVRLRKGTTEESLGSCQTKQAEDAIKAAAISRKDHVLLTLVADVDFVAKEVMYHHSCKRMYIILGDKATGIKNGNSDNVRPKCEGIALPSIYSYVERSIITNMRPEPLPSIYNWYLEMCDDAEEVPLTSARNLLNNLEKLFGDCLKTSSLSKKKGTVVYPEGLAESAIRVAFDYTSSEEAVIMKAALLLRKATKVVQRIPLKDPLSLDDIRAGEASPPEYMLMFF